VITYTYREKERERDRQRVNMISKKLHELRKREVDKKEGILRRIGENR